MIKNDLELQAMLERIQYFHRIVANLRKTETNPANYKASAGGFLAEIDRMNLEVREYLMLHPSEAQEELLPMGTR
ncbi:MAG TPA: hypothetical protein VF791_10060 [Pyrinomonadaceae bacterium]